MPARMWTDKIVEDYVAQARTSDEYKILRFDSDAVKIVQAANGLMVLDGINTGAFWLVRYNPVYFNAETES